MSAQTSTYRKTYIRAWRKHRGLTQERLAARIDVSTSQLSMLERGERPYNQKQLEALAEALATDPASLLMRDPDDPEAFWTIWDQAEPGQRRQITEVAKALLKAG